jgi:hypothetical protein
MSQIVSSLYVSRPIISSNKLYCRFLQVKANLIVIYEFLNAIIKNEANTNAASGISQLQVLIVSLYVSRGTAFIGQG